MAEREGVSLNQLILWAVADKVASLRHSLDDPRYPQVTYRSAAGGQPVPVLKGSGVRVVTLYVATRHWGLSVAEVAEQYGLSEGQVGAALAFAEANRRELESTVEEDQALAESAGR